MALIAIAVASAFSSQAFAADKIFIDCSDISNQPNIPYGTSWPLTSGSYERVIGYNLIDVQDDSQDGGSKVSLRGVDLKVDQAVFSSDVNTVKIVNLKANALSLVSLTDVGLSVTKVQQTSGNSKISVLNFQDVSNPNSGDTSSTEPSLTTILPNGSTLSIKNSKLDGTEQIAVVDIGIKSGSYKVTALSNTLNLFDVTATKADIYGVKVLQPDGQSSSDFEATNNDIFVSESHLKSITGIKLQRNEGAVIRAVGENELKIDKTTVKGDVTLFSFDVPASGSINERSSIRNNTLTLAGNVYISGKVSVVKTNAPNFDLFDSDIDAYENNTIAVKGTSNKVGGLEGFQNLSFTLTDANKSSDANVDISKAALTVTGPTTISAKQNILISGASSESETYNLIGVEGADASLTIEEGTKVTVPTTFVNQNLEVINGDLEYSDGGVFAIPNDRLGQPGGTEEPDPEDPTDPSEPVTPDDPQEPGGEQGGELVDVGTTATENSKTLSESYLGTMAFVNQGAEFIADEGLDVMVRASTVSDVASFAAIQGGSSNYNTGSRVDVDGYTLVAGASVKVAPNWVLGGFLEAGWADSDSHVNRAKGEADHDYYGVGVATRYMFNDSFYVDGSLRVGQASTEFKGLYAQDSAKYDSDVFYSTMHIGAGYIVPLTQSINLDVYGRYMLSYLDGDKVDLHNKYNDELDLDSTLTHAVRIGGRMTGAFCPYAGWKVGLAYEHVFDGDAESAVSGLNLEVPSLEGDTAIMELGVTMKPSQNSPWSMDLGAKGYAGDRKGVTGNIVVRYAF